MPRMRICIHAHTHLDGHASHASHASHGSAGIAGIAGIAGMQATVRPIEGDSDGEADGEAVDATLHK
ncbi:unnamed protein product, partial [Effrenium voratum]